MLLAGWSGLASPSAGSATVRVEGRQQTCGGSQWTRGRLALVETFALSWASEKSRMRDWHSPDVLRVCWDGMGGVAFDLREESNAMFNMLLIGTFLIA
jgi:hypothetical protein